MVKKVFLCGIKGTGMSNLALILKRMGFEVSGCDVSTFFSTQLKIEENDIKIYEGFNFTDIKTPVDYFIYSSAYSSSEMVIKASAKFKSYSYPQFLAHLSLKSQTYAVCGTHGKTSISALTTFALSQGKRKEFPFYSVYGSNIIGEDEVCVQGHDNLLIEGCEYQDHFLLYKTDGVLISNIEMDHPDYFKDIDNMIDSYKKLVLNVKTNGFVILNTDDTNTSRLIPIIQQKRPDLNIISYGYSLNSTVTIVLENDRGTFSIPLLYNRTYSFTVPAIDRRLISNYVASAILSTCMLLDRPHPSLYLEEETLILDEAFLTLINRSLEIVQDFPGVSRRLEFVAGSKGIMYFDDYAHHPTEIKTVYNELHARYPEKKILCIFTPHTASRTKNLMENFVDSLTNFDKVLLTPTFKSARNDGDAIDPSLTLYDKLKKRMEEGEYINIEKLYYLEGDGDIVDVAVREIGKNYICLVLGAGNKTYLIDEILEMKG
jgi:UDP-N-acetylmuramate--alanine ligase